MGGRPEAKRRTVKATVVGGIVGLAFGLGIGTYIGAAPKECTPSCPEGYGTLVKYALYGAGTGGVAGFMIAGHIYTPRWVAVFPVH